jgi:signal transduction histidine kinase
MKIREKLLLSVLSAVLAVLAAISWFSYASSKQALVREIERHADSMLKAYAWQLDSEIASLPIMTHGMAVAIASLYPTNADYIKELIRISLDINPNAYGSTIAFAPGTFSAQHPLFAPYYYRSDGELLYKDLANASYNYPAWDWYKKPVESGKPGWSEPYVDVGGGDIAMTTYSLPFDRNGKLLGVATVDIALASLTDNIEKIVVGQTGRAFLLSKNGTFLTLGSETVNLKKTIFDIADEHPDIAREVRQLGQDMTAGRSGFIAMKDPLGGKDAWVVYGPIPTTGWSLGIIFPEQELLGELASLRRNMIITSGAGLAFLIVLIVLISSRISKPIRALADCAAGIAEGDLSREAVGTDSADEVGALARSFRDMQLSLVDTLNKLHEEKEMFSAAFSQMSDGLVILSPHWDALQFNRAAERLLMLPAESTMLDHLLAHFDSSLPVDALSNALTKTVVFNLSRRENETLGPLALSAIITPIVVEGGELKELVMSVRDVTAEKAEDTSKANFLSLISHKLRTPVALLKSGVALLKDGLLGAMNDKQARQVDSMNNQISKLQSLIEGLIGYSAIEGIPLDSARENVELGIFWQGLAKEAAKLYLEKNAKLSMDLPGDIGAINFNRQYLGMIFAQLVDNALKFNLSDPAEVHIACVKHGSEIVTAIRDNGIGIPPEYLDRIFEKFFQIEKYFTGNVEGMGLGLSYVKTIVEHFGGRIEVQSKPGEGSTFTVTLPAS